MILLVPNWIAQAPALHHVLLLLNKQESTSNKSRQKLLEIMKLDMRDEGKDMNKKRSRHEKIKNDKVESIIYTCVHMCIHICETF